MTSLVRSACLCSALLALVLVAGCGGGGGSTAPAPQGTFLGVEAVGALNAVEPVASPGRLSAAAGTLDLNPQYTNCYLIPLQYSVALTKFELMKSEDDENPYVVFDTGDLTAPRVVDLTNGQTGQFGENTELPPAGTYTHIRMTIVYFQSQFNMDPGAGVIETGTFRAYASSVGNIRNGDIVQLREDNWYWMTASNAGTIPGFSEEPFSVTTDQGPRPDDNSGYGEGNVPNSIVVQEFHFSAGDDVSVDPYVQVLALPSPLVIPADPTGKYQIVTTFDVTGSDLDDGATGVFAFDDVDNDGIFEPGTGYGEVNGVGRDFNDGVHGEPMFSILPPRIEMSFTQLSQ